MSKNKDKIQALVRDLESVDTIKLTEVSPLDALGEEAAEVVKVLMDNPDPIAQRAGTLINSILTQKNQFFLLSTRLMQHLIKTDPNINIKSHTHANQKAMMHRVLRSKVIEILEPPTGQKAGLYKLIRDVLVEILYKEHGKEYFEAQEKVARDLYHNYKNTGSDNKTFEELEQEFGLKGSDLKGGNGTIAFEKPFKTPPQPLVKKTEVKVKPKTLNKKKEKSSEPTKNIWS